MKIRDFRDRVKDSEPLDFTTKVTIPDLSLSVRDILLRFTSGTMSPPDIEYGDDEDIDGFDNTFDDLVDAFDAVNSGKSILNDVRSKAMKDQQNIKEANQETKEE